MMKRKTLSTLTIALALLACAGSLQAAVVTVFTTTDNEFSVSRNSGAGIVESNLHAKAVSGTSNADRFMMIRFDSTDLGASVTAATLQLATSGFQSGAFTFTVYGVINGDAQDEAVTEGTYLPGAAGAVFNGDGDLIDAAQLTSLGTFSLPSLPPSGTIVSFTSAALLTFVQADTNDIATFIVTRNTDSASNSTFQQSNAGDTLRPQLILTVPDAPAIPEPASVFMGLAGLALIAVRRRVSL